MSLLFGEVSPDVAPKNILYFFMAYKTNSYHKRASAFEAGCRGFESLRAHHLKNENPGQVVLLVRGFFI